METFTWRDELLADAHARIARYGYTMQYVSGGGRRHPPWTYTIGLIDHEHPELVVSGLDPENAAGVVSSLADRVLDGDRLEDKSPGPIDLHGRPMLLLSVDPQHWWTDRFAVWIEYYGCLGRQPEPAAMQIVGSEKGWPERDKPFLAGWQRRQELLGTQ